MPSNGSLFSRVMPWLLALPLAVTGCGQTNPATDVLSKLVPVTGKVTLNGQPLDGVMVTYLTGPDVASGEVAYAITDAEGAYSLRTSLVGIPPDKAKGAFPGEYRVTITKLVTKDGSGIPVGTTDADAEAMGARQLLPTKFSSMDATQLKASVQGPESVNNFDLKNGK